MKRYLIAGTLVAAVLVPLFSLLTLEYRLASDNRASTAELKLVISPSLW